MARRAGNCEYYVLPAFVAALAIGAVVSPSAFAQRAQQQLATADTKTVAQSTGIAGLTFSPFVGVEGGYDTNLDQRIHGQASRYEMVQAGARANWRPLASEAYTLYLRGRRFEYDQLENSTRYDLDASIGARLDLSSTAAVKLGASYNRDAISLLSPVDIFGSFVDFAQEGEDYRIRLNAVSRTELSLKHGELPGLLDTDVFDVSRTSAFDFTKNGATLSALMFRRNLIAPFLIGNYTHISYQHQAPDPAIDRDANEGWGVAGLRISPGKSLYVDLGARANRREFEDRETKSFDSRYFDGRFSWWATETLVLRGVIERQIKEPTTSFGLADDVRTYELAVEKQIGPWFFYVRGFLDRITPVGEDFKFEKYYWATGLRYDLGKQVELYTDYGGKFVKEQIQMDEYERHRISTGVRMKF